MIGFHAVEHSIKVKRTPYPKIYCQSQKIWLKAYFLCKSEAINGVVEKQVFRPISYPCHWLE